MDNKPKQFSDAIYTIGGKNKFLDFRNGLNVAYPEDYAMLHGAGGGDHAHSSVIGVTITDYADAKNVKFLRANVSPHIVDQMLTVCRANIGERTDGSADLAAAMTGMNALLERVYGGLLGVVAKGVSACSKILKGTGHEKGPVADLGQIALAGRDAMTSDAEIRPFGVRHPYTEFTFHQDKVNSYRTDPNDGFVFVTVVDISRKEMNDKGEKRRYPWTVQIKNLWAPPINQPNGTTAYSATNARDVQETFFQATDDDMYHACWAVDHFVRVWENACCIPLVLEGAKRRLAEIEAKKNARD